MATPFLTRVAVQNFRAVGPGELELGLAPLTIIVGENGAGKSSVLQALALTAQSALDDPRRSDLILDGSRVQLGIPEEQDYRSTYRHIYYCKKIDQPLAVLIEAQVTPSAWPVSLRTPLPKNSGLKSWPPKTVGYRWSRKGLEWPAFSHEFLADGRHVFSIATEMVSTGPNSATPNTTWQIAGDGGPLEKRTTHTRSPERVLSEEFLRLGAEQLLVGSTDGQPREDLAAAIEVVGAIATLLRDYLGHLALVDPLRGRQLALRDVGPEVSFVGPHGELVVRFLNLLRNRSSERFDLFRAWAERFNIRGVETGTAGNQIKVAFRDPATNTPLDLSEAATGSYQALVMAAQVLLSEPGSILLYEEPENNLHPRFEKLLPALYADAIRTGHQIIVTTHSEVLVAAVGNVVREGILDAKDVSVWELTRSPKLVKATPIHVSKKGYLDEWVRSFGAVEQELFHDWTKTLPEARQPGDRGQQASRRKRTKPNGRKRRTAGRVRSRG